MGWVVKHISSSYILESQLINVINPNFEQKKKKIIENITNKLVKEGILLLIVIIINSLYYISTTIVSGIAKQLCTLATSMNIGTHIV